jgi:beta-lactamase regulating signal transducer with metallopeptidase domain
VWFLALMAVVGIACLGGIMLRGLHSPFLATSSVAAYTPSMINLPAHWAAYVLVAWVLAVAVALARLSASVVHLYQLRATCTPVDPATLDSSLRETLEELNRTRSFAARSVTLSTSDRVRVPAALGLWRPMIALPAWALAELPPADLSIILRHEFAHLRRWDDWTNLLQKTVRALFFFHPAVWWIENRLSVEREMACDDIVVAQTCNPMGYASCLVSLLERGLAQRGWAMAQAIVHRAREASDRLTQILDKNRPPAAGISKPALGMVGLFALVCVVMAPQTPQLVAFDKAPSPEHEYSAALNLQEAIQPEMVQTALVHPATFHPATVRPALVHPAKLRTSSPRSAVIQATLRTNASDTRTNLIATERKPSAPSSSPNKNSESVDVPWPLESIIEASALASEFAPPSVQTLLFVETTQLVPVTADNATQRVASESAPANKLWKVQVWRVTVIRTTWKVPAQVSVATKT